LTFPKSARRFAKQPGSRQPGNARDLLDQLMLADFKPPDVSDLETILALETGPMLPAF
jgi:hypothetical protein